MWPRWPSGAASAIPLTLLRSSRNTRNARPGNVQKIIQRVTEFVGILNREADTAAGMCECDEVDWVQVNAILGIAEEYHLFPLNLSKRIVLDDDNLDWQLVFYSRYKVGHQ